MNTNPSVVRPSAGLAVLILAALVTPSSQLYAQVKVDFSLHRSTVQVGEPLVVSLVATNDGADVVRSPYASQRNFQKYVDADFIVTQDSQQIPLLGAQRSDIKVVGWDAFSPGRSLKAERIIPLVRSENGGRPRFLDPGTYQLKSSVKLRAQKGNDAVWITIDTPEHPFTIQVPEESHVKGVEALAGFPNLVTFLKGIWGPPNDEMIRVERELTEKYPQLPHLKYMEACFLRARLQGNDLDNGRTAVSNYLAKFPDSPFGDDLLLQLGYLEEHMEPETIEGISRVIPTFEKIVKDYPDSPLVEEAQAELAKLRAMLAEATAPATETNSVETTSTSNSVPTTSP